MKEEEAYKTVVERHLDRVLGVVRSRVCRIGFVS